MWNNLISKNNLRKLLRYLILFTAVFIASQFTPECRVSYTTSFIMASIAAITFAITDMYFPILVESEPQNKN